MITLPRIVLISLAVFGDVVGSLPASRKQAWDFWFGDGKKYPRRKSYLAALERLLKTEYIEKVADKGKVRLRITPRGLKFLSMSLDLDKFSRRPWDKKWRAVVFDIWERRRKQRAELREYLKYLGFGMLQESIWISPFPIEKELNDFLSRWRIAGEVLVSKSEILFGDQRKIAHRVWKLGRLGKRYDRLRGWWQGLPPPGKNKQTAFDFQQRYFSLLWEDPFLPRELLPDDWPAEAVERVYSREVIPILHA